jgi:glycosyltransferase involved in cell wall biosynthesis
MKICLDIQPAIAQQAGVGRYTAMLAKHLGPCTKGDTLSLFYFDFKNRGHGMRIPGAVDLPYRRIPGRFIQFAWKTLHVPDFSRFAGDHDVYHFTNFIIPPLKRGKAVVSIHDVSFARYPEFAERKNLKYLNSRIGDTVNRADAIITISQFSADEIVELLGADRSKIHVTHLGIPDSFKRQDGEKIIKTLESFSINGPYLLCVGTIEPRKNHSFLIDVFEMLDKFDGYLVIAGMPGWQYEPILRKILGSRKADRIRWLRYVSDSDLTSLYSGAEAFVFPSHYEGFGFPPVEAMACGTPVITSSGGSLAEICGNGAIVLNEFDKELWAWNIMKVLTDKSLRQDLAVKGPEQAAKYRWDETARKTVDIYRSVC